MLTGGRYIQVTRYWIGFNAPGPAVIKSFALGTIRLDAKKCRGPWLSIG